MASSPIPSWQIDEGKMETMTEFIFLGSKITVDRDHSHEIKRCLLLRRKAMTNLESVLKSRDITLPTKVHLVTALVFLVVMYRCESWTIEKAECRRIDAFKLWYWRRVERVYKWLCTGLVAPWHVGSSQTRGQVHVPSLAGRFLTTGSPGKSPFGCS